MVRHMIKSLNSFLQIQKFKKLRRNKSTLEKKMSNQNQKEELQIPATNSDVNILIVITLLRAQVDFSFMSKVFMKKFLMTVVNVTKVLVINQLSIGMWKLFIWIWRISNVTNVTNLLDKNHILKLTLHLSTEMRRNSNVTIVINLFHKNTIVMTTLEESTKCKMCIL